MKEVVYSLEIDQIHDSEGAIVAKIPAVFSKQELTEYFGQVLNFPDYLGNNWDELIDYLRDLDWIKTKKIHIIHENLSYLPDKDLSVYLSIVYIIAVFWRQFSSIHCITFFFNPAEKERIDTVFRKEAEEVERQYHLIDKLNEMKLRGEIDDPNSHSRI